jgi:FKBP-type peptidyl-prolyl cis-trans isomerase SlyD
MALEENKVVSISYTLKDENGEMLDVATKEQPFVFLSGQNQILPNLEKKISKMVIGSQQKVILSPEEGYGEYRDEAVREVKRSDFPDKIELEVGQRFMADLGEGQQRPFFVKEVSDNEVTIDFNHPLAGITLEFNLELLDIRDATDEEIMHGHVHGPGGHQH